MQREREESGGQMQRSLGVRVTGSREKRGEGEGRLLCWKI